MSGGANDIGDDSVDEPDDGDDDVGDDNDDAKCGHEDGINERDEVQNCKDEDEAAYADRQKRRAYQVMLLSLT